jgi:hypothetical protein
MMTSLNHKQRKILKGQHAKVVRELERKIRLRLRNLSAKMNLGEIVRSLIILSSREQLMSSAILLRNVPLTEPGY